MDNEEKRNITLLVILLLFSTYSIQYPFFFNGLVHRRIGRILIISMILFICYYNLYLGLLTTLLIIALSQNLIEENIVYVKPQKPEWVEPSGFYKFFGYERTKENFVTRGASKTQGKPKSTLKTSDILKRLDDVVYDPEEQNNLDYLKKIPEIPELEKYSTKNYYITDLLNIENALMPKNSSTMIASPVFLVNNTNLHK